MKETTNSNPVNLLPSIWELPSVAEPPSSRLAVLTRKIVRTDQRREQEVVRAPPCISEVRRCPHERRRWLPEPAFGAAGVEDQFLLSQPVLFVSAGSFSALPRALLPEALPSTTQILICTALVAEITITT